MASKQDYHKHKFDSRSYTYTKFKDDVMYILFNKCKCGLKHAYDLTYTKPK